MHNFQSNRDLERKLGSLAKIKHIKTETTLKEAKKNNIWLDNSKRIEIFSILTS